MACWGSSGGAGIGAGGVKASGVCEIGAAIGVGMSWSRTGGDVIGPLFGVATLVGVDAPETAWPRGLGAK